MTAHRERHLATTSKVAQIVFFAGRGVIRTHREFKLWVVASQDVKGVFRRDFTNLHAFFGNYCAEAACSRREMPSKSDS
jgi:hypothetical protein